MSFLMKFFAVALFTVSGVAYGQLPPPRDPTPIPRPSFIRTTITTDLMCGHSVNIGNGPQCGEPTAITHISASSSACTPIKAQDSRCPVAEHFRGRSKDCGVESYSSGTGFECGSDSHEFWSDWGGSCPGTTVLNGSIGVVSIGSIDTEVRIHRDGWKVSSQTRHKCKGKAPRTCRNEKFGVELYKECNLGVKSYETCTVAFESCRHPDHGEESRSYPGCRHEAFGITAESCRVPDFKLQKEEIERLSSELSSYLLAIDNVKSISSPIITTLTAAKGVLESTRTFLISTEAEINAKITVAPTDSLRENLLTTKSDLLSVNEAIRRIQECESNSAVCDINGSVVVNTLETRVYYVRQSLSVIRKFLIDQDSYWSHAADSFRAQIKELLDSPQMKNPS